MSRLMDLARRQATARAEAHAVDNHGGVFDGGCSTCVEFCSVLGIHLTPTPEPYRYVGGRSLLGHADHCYETTEAYLIDRSDAPAWVTGDMSGITCHDCRLILF